MIDSENKIGAIEGNSFSGKTALVKKLESDYGFFVVWEPSTYTRSFPSFPPESYSEAKKAINIFVEIEKKRSIDAINLAKNNNYVVMDRSLWTYPAFQYVVMKTMPDVPNSYLYSLDVLQENVSDNEIIIPSLLISLMPRGQTEFERRISERGRVGIDFLNDWNTTVLMDLLYRTVIDNAYWAQSGKSISSAKKTDEIAIETKKFLEQSYYSIDTNQAFEKLRILK
ncbi:MAG: hypothetical protein ACD_19C00176G0049 [uncultured bacterium]|nr:MAG: hypothetical protein ACD_19C00176G0049 [uncultured bacterium]